MIRHVLKLVWNRKRANALIIVELFVTFLVLFALASSVLNFFRLYRQPLGFEVADTLSVRIGTGGGVTEADRSSFRQVLNVLEQMQGVAAVEIMNDPVFFAGSSAMRLSVGGVDTRVEINDVSTDFPTTVGMTLLAGRWFGPGDDAQTVGTERVVPVLVNRTFAELAGGDVLGTMYPLGDQQQRVIGVFDDFRQHGEFTVTRPFMLQRMRTDADFGTLPLVVVKTRPGIDAGFEERLLETLQRLAPGWDFDTAAWTALQQAHRRTYVVPIMITGIVVGFLLLLVGFGLLGVLWQNVIRRTPEMGLRRAMGASAGAVRLQVVLELLAVALFALVLGLVIVVQFPLSGILRALDWALFVPAAVLSAALLLGLCILFALYPSYQATRQDPVEALRYE